MPDSDLNSLLKGAPAANKAPELRSFTDYPTIRKNILDNVMSAVTSKFPLQNARYRIDLEQPAYARTDDYSLREQQEAIMQQQSLYMPLRGQLTMRDIATNQVIDKTDGPVTLARVPYLTNRGTFINSGSEYTVANQSRLLAGPYVRRRKSGEYEAHFNTNPGKGRGFRMVFMPDTGKFVMEIGQSMSPAYPALRALGVDDTTIAKVWGQRLADINKQHSAYDAARLYERLTNNPTSGMDEAAIYAGIKEALEKTELDPAVTRRTLGGATAKLGSVPMRGTMRIESEGYVTVPQEFVDSVFYALRDSDKATAISPVNDKGRLVVLDSDELKGLRKVYKHDFEATVGSGRRFTYNLADVLPDPSIEGTWFVKVDSPELQQFRRSLGLPQVPNGGFRIHVGDKVDTGKLENLMSKAAAGKALVGGHDSFLKDPLPLDDNAYGRITGQTMLRASQKILNAQNGFEDTDDRDALSYQKFYGPEDYFSERIEKDAGGVLRTALFKATNRGNLAPFRSSVFTPILNGVLIGSGLAAPIEEVNPIDILDQNMRLIRTGEGGISSSAHGVPRDTRSVQPSHFGIVDPIRTPESGSVGIDLRLAIGALKGRDGQIYSRLRNAKTGKLEPVSASNMADAIVAFPGETERAKRTGDPVRAMKAGRISYVSPDEVQYELPSYANMFNINSNLVPGISGLKGGRLLMGSKYFTQALPVRGGEAPLVQALDPSDLEGKSFESGVSQHLGAVRSNADLGPGLVTDVTGDQITVKHGKTKQTYELYNNFPYNRKSYVHNTPLVKVGDQVKPGQLLAKSNYTDDQGNLAMGRNLRVAYMVWGDPEQHGANFEDGVVMSESAAKKMSAEHMYLVGYDGKDDFKADKSKYISLFPGQYKAEQLKNIDDRGVVKIGTVLNEGDPMILGVGERQGDTFGLMKKSRPTFLNRVQAWDHASPGVVTAVTKTRGGYQIAVKAYKPMEIGDKLVGRYGDKGVIASVVPDEQMPKNEAGDPYEVLYNPLGLVTRCYDAETEFLTKDGWVFGKDVKPTDQLLCYRPWSDTMHFMDQLAPMHSAPYKGPMLTAKSTKLDMCVTPNHRMWAKCSFTGAKWQEITAQEIYRKNWTFPTVGQPMPGVLEDFILPTIEIVPKDNRTTTEEIRIPAALWAEFLGWYLAEGNTTYSTKQDRPEYKVHISQSDTANPEKCARITALLNQLPFTWHYSSANKQFHISSKRLAAYLKQFGLCDGKFIPTWVYEQPADIRQIFIDAYWAGDGRKATYPDGRSVETVSSRSTRLVDDMQRLLVMQGVAASKRDVKTKDPELPMWRCAVYQDRTVGAQTQHWDTVDYDGMIYCPTVPTGYVLTRRNGKLLIAGNTNPIQAVEAVLGKVAAKTGKPVMLPAFMDESFIDHAMRVMRENKVSDTDTVFDPQLNKKVPGVFSGVRYFMNLHHQAEGKLTGRDTGAYSVDEAPLKGGDEGAKRIGIADINAMLAHGAVDVLKDARLIRGQKNDEYWRAVKLGQPVPAVNVPFVWDKFVSQLRGAGVNVTRQGGAINIYGMTGKDVKALSGGEVKQPKDIDFRTGEAYKDGFFDERIFGANQSHFGHFPLATPIINPVMEDVVRSLTGLTQKDFEAVVSGENVKGVNGMPGLMDRLKAMDISKEIDKAKQEIANSRGQRRSNAITRLSYLDGMAKRNVRPEDFVWTDMPVLPPRFRPITDTGSMQMVSDINYLYKELFAINNNLKDLHGELGDTDLSKDKLALYKAVKAAVGLTDPASTKLQQKGVNGLIKQILGTNPKFSLFQRKVLSSTVEGVGNAVITPDPALDMDHVGVPEEMAFRVFRPYVIQSMVRAGATPLQAMKEIELRSEPAKRELLRQMEQRPVLITRAPVLHKYNFLAARPVLTTGNTMRLSPSIVVGFNADFDGDQMRLHVPSSPEAVRQAYAKMLPSRNLLSAATFQTMPFIKNEFLFGLHLASKAQVDKNNVKVFRSKEDVIKAFNRGEVAPTDTVKIIG